MPLSTLHAVNFIAFVPKLVLFVIVPVRLAPWMLNRLTAFAVTTFARVAQ